MHLLAVFQSPRNIFTPFFGWLEQATYRIINVDPSSEMDWKTYAKALVGFNVIGFIFLFGLLMFQSYLPFNPQHFPGLAWPLAFNTAVSFVTNTNWQAYAGETTLSYGSQMLGLTARNWSEAIVHRIDRAIGCGRSGDPPLNAVINSRPHLFSFHVGAVI
jgi:K+-transporting ATPase ATPase A chain